MPPHQQQTSQGASVRELSDDIAVIFGLDEFNWRHDVAAGHDVEGSELALDGFPLGHARIRLARHERLVADLVAEVGSLAHAVGPAQVELEGRRGLSLVDGLAEAVLAIAELLALDHVLVLGDLEVTWGQHALLAVSRVARKAPPHELRLAQVGRSRKGISSTPVVLCVVRHAARAVPRQDKRRLL